jgi:two-component system phosphate regulon response regulator OmpR
MSANKPKILIIDDDLRLRDLLLRYLGEQGFDPGTEPDASGLNKRLERNRPDLVVLDLMLPGGEDGLAVCRRLRGAGEDIPIIMLTAKGDEIDRIIGLEMGADDYLPKPFNPRELVARIHAVLRRRTAAPASAPVESGAPIAFGEFVLDPSTRTLSRNDQPVPITSGEFALLLVLASHPMKPMSRERLLELTRGRAYDAFDRSIDVQISRLRRLIEPDPANPHHIQTLWGFGYVFVTDGQKP